MLIFEIVEEAFAQRRIVKQRLLYQRDHRQRCIRSIHRYTVLAKKQNELRCKLWCNNPEVIEEYIAMDGLQRF